jgi:uridine kinase
MKRSVKDKHAKGGEGQLSENIMITINEEKISFPKGVTIEEVVNRVFPDRQIPVVGARISNEIRELTYKLEEDCAIDFLDLTDEDGIRIYVRGLSFIFIRAVRELYPGARVTIEHSLSKGLYCEIHWERPMTPRDITAVEKRMKEIVEANEAFVKMQVSKQKAIEIFSKDGQDDKVRLLKYRKHDFFKLYKCGWMYDYFYGYMVPLTGYLKRFKLHFYLPGVILLYPQKYNPMLPLRFLEQKKLARIYHESEKWGKIVEVTNVADLNSLIESGRVRELIRINEALHEKKIAQIADEISANRQERRIILIAGPSSSGKTTFAQRLFVQLRVNGMKPISISLDNYYKDRSEAPIDDHGEVDFEDIRAIDLELFNEQLSSLLQGEGVEIPVFNFQTGKREFNGHVLRVTEDQAIIVEGIHGLNDALTEMIPKEHKFKIYISALTQLNLDDHNRIPSTDTRLIRRMIRDFKYRSSSPTETLSMWKSVRRGEEKNIFPYQEEADVMFNSALTYELAVLKKYITPLLEQITDENPYYTEAKRLQKFMNYFLSLDEQDEIPPNSILREFIGGSCFYK